MKFDWNLIIIELDLIELDLIDWKNDTKSLKINWIRLDCCKYWFKITWLLNLIIIELDLIELDLIYWKNDKKSLKIKN